MKDYVIDANIIFSSLISGKGFYRKLFENYLFYTPDFALNEIHLYQAEILKKTKLNKEQLQEFTLFIFSKLIIVPEFYISAESRKKSYDLCKDIDLKDIIYLALSIEIRCPLITRDKPLYNGLTQKNYTNIILFEEFISEVNKDINLFNNP